MPELVLERVGKRYGAALVLRNVDCAFTRGTVTLVTGGNGAGKSTLLKIMAGQVRAAFSCARRAAPPVPDRASAMWATPRFSIRT